MRTCEIAFGKIFAFGWTEILSTDYSALVFNILSLDGNIRGNVI